MHFCNFHIFCLRRILQWICFSYFSQFCSIRTMEKQIFFFSIFQIDWETKRIELNWRTTGSKSSLTSSHPPFTTLTSLSASCGKTSLQNNAAITQFDWRQDINEVMLRTDFPPRAVWNCGLIAQISCHVSFNGACLVCGHWCCTQDKSMRGSPLLETKLSLY